MYNFVAQFALTCSKTRKKHSPIIKKSQACFLAVGDHVCVWECSKKMLEEMKNDEKISWNKKKFVENSGCFEKDFFAIKK